MSEDIKWLRAMFLLNYLDCTTEHIRSYNDFKYSVWAMEY